MFVIDSVISKLENLVGWEQNQDPSDEQLTDNLLISESGLFFQGVHPLLTIKNIKNLAPFLNDITRPEWDNAENYKTGAVVYVGQSSNKFEALRDNVGLSPDSNSDDWRPYTEFSGWLSKKVRSSIIKALSSWKNHVKSDYPAKSLLENKVLYDGTGRLSETETNSGKCAGIEFTATKDRGINTVLERVGLQFTQAGSVTLYLFHSSKESSVDSITLNYTTANSVQWFDLGWSIPYHSETVDVGGSYYVRYKQSEIPGQAINKVMDYSQTSQGYVSRSNDWSKYLKASPFTSNESDDLGDIDSNSYYHSKNYGLNFKISVKCDYTDFIIDQRDIFREVIYYQVGVDLLKELLYNPNSRINESSGFDSQRLGFEVFGDTQGRPSGLNYDLMQAIKSAKIDTGGISKYCLGCQEPPIRFK